MIKIKKLKKILKIIILALMILLIVYFIYREIKLPSFLADGYYIIDFEKNNKTLSKKDENKLIKLFITSTYTIKESDNIKITKIAYQSSFRYEANCYIFFKTNIDSRLPFILINVTENHKEYVIEHVCMNTDRCEKYNIIKSITTNNYKWWENNEKYIKYAKIEEPYRTEITDKFLLKNYEVVSGENLSGEIVDITDKFLKIQTDKNDIKLVEIDWESTGFVNYRTKDSLRVFDIEIGDYFLNKQIIRNITGEELIKESLKNMVDGSRFYPEEKI